MLTETFIELRAKQLHQFFRMRFGRHWRYTVAAWMGRRDAPRWLVARVGTHPITLAKLIPVERLAEKLSCPMGCPRWGFHQKRCPDDAADRYGPGILS